jgi:hypothetical protein
MVGYSEYFRERLGVDPQDKDEWKDFFREAHGDIEDAKVKLLFIGDEEGFAVEAEDIEDVTDEPPVETFQ